jgi:uncharacterized protein
MIQRRPDKHFLPLDQFRKGGSKRYSLLPLRFISLDKKRCLLTNFAGEYCVLERKVLHAFLHGALTEDSPEYARLKSKQFLMDDESTIGLELLAAKYRTKQSYLTDFTRLHIIVPTLRCNNRCGYCQVSRQGPSSIGYDMTPEVADKAIEFTFRSPARRLKVEFQGGEPLLQFPLVKHIVEKCSEKARAQARNVDFVICTNLSLLDDDILEFCAAHDVYFSTSLDGPRALHNLNRPNPDFESYDQTVSGISRVREALGRDKISALVTTTRASLSQPVAIVDEYLRQGFNSMFLRPINPYGLAARTTESAGYTAGEWLRFYMEALDYILELNYQGISFRESYACLLLQKILTPYSTGFVDLQSPAGVGIGVIVFNYDGNVYASDESRMLAEMGDSRFRLGNLLANTYEEVMLSDTLIRLVRETMTEGVPQCCDCGVQPYCGSDPVRHYRTQGDTIGYKPTSEFCTRNMAIIKRLIWLLETDAKASEALKGWIS